MRGHYPKPYYMRMPCLSWEAPDVGLTRRVGPHIPGLSGLGSWASFGYIFQESGVACVRTLVRAYDSCSKQATSHIELHGQ